MGGAPRGSGRGFDPGEFAAAVIELYRHAVESNPKPFQENISLEVRQTAFGLALIHHLLDHHLKSMHLSADITASGIREAYGILDHLTTGKDHPIAKHIKGIHSGRFRPQHAPKNAIEQEGRKIVVAVVRTYAKAANVSQLKARQVVIAEAAKADCKFTDPQIKKWDDRFRGLGGADAFPSVGPDVYAAKLSEAGDAKKILALGVTWIWQWWAVPMPPIHRPPTG